MKYDELPTQLEVVKSSVRGLTAKDQMEDEAGNCWRHTRLRLVAAGFPPELIPPIGTDAAGAARWYRKHHPSLCKAKSSVPGDVLFFEKGHGEHGHVVTRIPGNLVAENSVVHAPEGQKDGRGTRPLGSLGKPSLIMRPWRAI